MSSRPALVALLLLLAACASPPAGTVTGRVVFAGESDHAGVVVSASRGATVTGPDGRFVLTGLSGSTTTVLFVAQGSVEVSQSRAVDVGAELPDVVFRPAGSVRGSVVDADTREPLRGALVVAAGGPGAATSAGDGTFTLSGIPAGDATLVVSFTGKGTQQKAVKVARGAPLDLGAIALGPVPPDSVAAIAGRVVYADGTPAQAAQVRLTAPPLDLETQTGADGRFSFDKIRPGVVRLVLTAGEYGAVLPAVLSLEGTSGLIVANGLFPLSTNAVELTRGTHLSDLTGGTLSANRDLLVGTLATPLGGNLRAVTIATGASVDLLTDEEIGLSSPAVAAIGLDSTTIAVSLADPSGSDYARQVFLASTVSAGRQLIADRACIVGTLPDTLYYVPGANCRYGGSLMAAALRFGAAPVAVGALSTSYLNDLKHGQLFDLVQRGMPATGMDVDLVRIGPVPSRKRIATGIARSLQVSPDGRYYAYSQSYSSASSDGTLEVYDTVEDRTVHLLDHVNVSLLDYTATGRVVVYAYLQPARSFDLATGAATVLGTGQPVHGVVVPRDGSGAFLYRRATDSELGVLTHVSLTGGPETKVCDDVLWYRASPDDAWLYFLDDVELATRRGRLARVKLSGGPVVGLDSAVAAGTSSGALPVFSTLGERVAWVRYTPDGHRAIAFDAVTGIATDLAPLEDPQTWRWTFSPGGRYLGFDALAGTPKVLNVIRADGGPRSPVTSDATLVWLDEKSALFHRYSARPWTGAAGTWRATFE